MKRADSTAPLILELEALEQAVRWPNPSVQSIATLAGQFMAAHRDADAFTYFAERAAEHPQQYVFLALEGVFQARMAGSLPVFRRPGWVREALRKLDTAATRAPGLTTYFRGVVEADLPGMFRRRQMAVSDLEWVLAHKDQFPMGLRRGAYFGLAKAHAALGNPKASDEALHRSGAISLNTTEPVLITDWWMTAQDGFRFTTPRLVELAPGVHVAQGYDFSDFAFVTTPDGIVVVDAATTEAGAAEALAAFRASVSEAPIKWVILTHAHWDHIGGLSAFRGPQTEVIAQSRFADELALVNSTMLPFRRFFASATEPTYSALPDRLISEPTKLSLGGVEFGLYPVSGGETVDGLLVHLPELGLVFTGDVLMPNVGAPFMPEGSVDGLLETIQEVRELHPKLLVHGHTPLTDLFTVETLPGLEASLRELRAHVLDAVRDSRPLAEVLRDNYLPDVLREHPLAVNPYLAMRDNVIQRLYRQRTGYWQPDGEGVDVIAPETWAAALDLVGGGKQRSFMRAGSALLRQGDLPVALKLTELGLRRYPQDRQLEELRRRTLHALRERNQQLNPFKFIMYSRLADAELQPAA
jgi:glyoxylase-like metal-dependent hydrolase (beta-lactamase superfamily II)